MIGELAFLYCGSNALAEDIAFYREGLGAELVWRFEQGGDTTVAAVRLGPGPLSMMGMSDAVPRGQQRYLHFKQRPV